MKRAILIFLLVLVLAGLMLAVAFYVPNSLPVNSDFLAIYNASLAIINRVPIYDLPAVREVALRYSDVPEEHFFLIRFLYPPWYALSAFYLGFMPVKSAAALWFEMNLLMFFASVWLLTDGWNGRLRLIAFPIALFFMPVLGTMSVGQFDFPVLLGASMLIYSLRRENVALTTTGIVLLTFKPHIGALSLLTVLILLFKKHRSEFRWSVIRSSLLTGGFLCAIGFIADPAWYIGYPKVLFDYGTSEHVDVCSECTSLPSLLSHWFFDGTLGPGTWIALVLLVVLIGLFFLLRSSLLKSHELFLSAALLVTLLVNPYLYNYNYLLLLVPFAVLASENNLADRITVLLCCLAPTYFVLAYGRPGNVSLLYAALVITVLVCARALRAKPRVDVPAVAS